MSFLYSFIILGLSITQASGENHTLLCCQGGSTITAQTSNGVKQAQSGVTFLVCMSCSSGAAVASPLAAMESPLVQLSEHITPYLAL